MKSETVQKAIDTITDPDGIFMRLVATVKTTPKSDASAKPIDIDSTVVEVILSDSEFISAGSQFGHIAIEVDGTVYSRIGKAYEVHPRENYLKLNDYRDNFGIILRVSNAEKEIIKKELIRRVNLGKPYNLLTNSCSVNVADVLEMVGILAHDPRFSLRVESTDMSSPTEIEAVLLKSKRVAKKKAYPKKTL